MFFTLDGSGIKIFFNFVMLRKCKFPPKIVFYNTDHTSADSKVRFLPSIFIPSTQLHLLFWSCFALGRNVLRASSKQQGPDIVIKNIHSDILIGCAEIYNQSALNERIWNFCSKFLYSIGQRLATHKLWQFIRFGLIWLKYVCCFLLFLGKFFKWEFSHPI